VSTCAVGPHHPLNVFADLKIVPRGAGRSSFHPGGLTNMEHLRSGGLIVDRDGIVAPIDRRDTASELAFVRGWIWLPDGVRGLAGFPIARRRGSQVPASSR